MTEVKKNIHEGHRERLRKRFLESGLESFNDHEVLELLLCFSIPRIDLNGLGHDLVDHFGSFHKVFDATFESLIARKGIGPSSAILISLIAEINKRYVKSRQKISKATRLKNSAEVGTFILPYYFAENEELFYIICLDSMNRLLTCRLMFRGGLNSVYVSARKIVETALHDKAEKVIISHNHMTGIALPTRDDLETTKIIENALKSVEIELCDHIIAADDDFVSLSDSGFFRK